MHRALPLLLICTVLAFPVQAQDVRYVSDDIFIVLHKGPGQEYRWKARLTAGTKLTVSGYSPDREWAEVTTERGTDGWVRSEFLSSEVPALRKLPVTEQRARELTAKNTELSSELEALNAERAELLGQLKDTDARLNAVSEELTQLKQVSGKAVQLDSDNRRLVEEAENLRAQADMLKAENQRLLDKLKSEDFINGALAVLLGVVITLVVPRLWPKRRRSSSWA